MKLLMKKEWENLQNLKIKYISNTEKIFLKDEFINYIIEEYKKSNDKTYNINIDFQNLEKNHSILNEVIKILNINISNINISNISEYNYDERKTEIQNKIVSYFEKNIDYYTNIKQKNKDRTQIVLEGKVLDIYDVESLKQKFKKSSPIYIRDTKVKIKNIEYTFDIVIDEKMNIVLDYLKTNNTLKYDNGMNIS